MKSVKPLKINWKIAFLPKQNIIILYDFLFFYTQSVASLISMGDSIINYNSKLYYSCTTKEIIENRINFVDRRMERVEKLNKLRKRSILWFKTFLIFTAFFFFFNWKDNLYLSFIMLFACLICTIPSIPLIRLHGYYEKDILKRLSKYRIHLNSEIDKITKAKQKEGDVFKKPILANSVKLGTLYNLLKNNNIIEGLTPKIFKDFALASFISSKKEKFAEKTLLTFFSDKEKNVRKMYNSFISDIPKTNKIEPTKEPISDITADRLFYHLKNSLFKIQIPDEQLKVLLKLFTHKVINRSESPIQLDKNEQISLKHVIKSQF
ncbi:hypothetical protein [Marinifilum fragile]|uniref:hypothetical protein n=1 Tax=Marinifilum fragile TaxID=570161 RepID=UPI002AAB4936|nr:hypothetical protein [Marinifilum fragile]